MPAAPDGAVYRREDGLVIVDPEKAQGPAASWRTPAPTAPSTTTRGSTCPRSARAARTWWTPASCPTAWTCARTGALRFGDEEDFAEEIAAATALVPERAEADRPRVYYLNAPKRFLAGVVVDLEADEVVVGAKVTAENLATGEVLAVETDEFGDFWFRQVGKAAWRVYVEAEGYLTRVLEASTAEEDRNMGPVALYKAE